MLLLAGMGSSEIVAAEMLQGDRVVNRRGEVLGTVEDLAIDMRRGCVAYALVARGGAPSSGERLLPIPWEALDFESASGVLILDMEPQEMELAPCLDLDDAAWATQVRAFYGVPRGR
jgi:sporulation protein YlmC with PRC-barrel domain